MKMALARALHHSAQRGWRARRTTRHGDRSLHPPGTRPASLAEPRGDVVQVRRHTVEQLADGAPRLPTLDVSVPQMVDQPVAVLARFDLLIPEQVIEVPKISCPSRFSRTALRSPRMAEQFVEVPVPSVHELTIMAPFVDTAGRRWCLITGPQGYSWWLVGTDHQQRDIAEDHRLPRAEKKYWARLRISLRPFVPGSNLFGVGLPEEYLCGFFLGDDFWISFRVQRFLVRQWIHVISSLRMLSYSDPAIDSRPALLFCVCREEYRDWIWCRARVDNVIGMLGLFALCSLFCYRIQRTAWYSVVHVMRQATEWWNFMFST